MKKIIYVKPETKVVQLQHQTQILTLSDAQTMQFNKNFNWDDEWENE